VLRLETPPVCRGEYFDVYFLVLDNGSVPAREFLERMENQGGKRARQVQRLKATMELRANLPPGKFMSAERFKPVEGINGIFEFKAHQLRVYCFYAPGRRIVLQFGVIKKKDKHRPADLNEAEALRTRFLTQPQG